MLRDSLRGEIGVQAPSGHHVHNTDVEVENEEALI
jgi:hypothetical protein